MSSESAELIAVLDAAELGPPRPIGVLRRRAGRRTVVSFEYARSWLDWPASFAIDPALELGPGETFVGPDLLPGVLSDTAPDRWGRRLLEGREAAAARNDRRTVRAMDDWDFLVGVADETRMGAIRLGLTRDGPFLEESHGVPPMTRLRNLEFAATEIERSPAGTIVDQSIALLLGPGSSLGGARPKANFVGEDDALWIAKFPSRDDRRDVGCWEFLLMQMARDAGIDVADSKRLTLSTAGSTFAARRFDRAGPDRRLYASAMTLARKRDGDDASYLDIAVAVTDHAAPNSIGDDLAQLFRRLVFNIMVGNRDDHLRNHGFLRTAAGWRLSPAFDLNPAPGAAEHALAIDDASREPDLDAAVETSALYRVTPSAAARIVREVAEVVAGWRARARSLGCFGDEIEAMAAVISPRT